MYYLRKEPFEKIIPEITKTDGTVIPERVELVHDRAIYKCRSTYYRKPFTGLNDRYQGMKVYTCKTLKKILQIRQNLFDYCKEWFDVYDENGKIDTL